MRVGAIELTRVGAIELTLLPGHRPRGWRPEAHQLAHRDDLTQMMAAMDGAVQNAGTARLFGQWWNLDAGRKQRFVERAGRGDSLGRLYRTEIAIASAAQPPLEGAGHPSGACSGTPVNPVSAQALNHPCQ